MWRASIAPAQKRFRRAWLLRKADSSSEKCGGTTQADGFDPDHIPYGKLPPAKRGWRVLNGYPDQGLAVKTPSVRGLSERGVGGRKPDRLHGELRFIARRCEAERPVKGT